MRQVLGTNPKASPTTSERPGHLFIIGGGEDRQDDMSILARYVELCGGEGCSIAVLTSASSIPHMMWEKYEASFGELGVRRHFHVAAGSRDEANDNECAQKVRDADGIFMSGGDQKRLVEIVGSTRIHAAMRYAFSQHAACIGGTSAGASAMARHMLAYGTNDKLPDKRTAQLESGLGFLPYVAIDQHFSERHRLARLLSVVAQQPDLIGLGIDEDTALIIGGSGHAEVVGNGAVTLLDGQHMASNIGEADGQDTLELINVVLHLVPANRRYAIGQTASGSSPAKEALIDVLRRASRMDHETT